MNKGVERVLIYRVGSLGDTVVALPALHLVARAFPAAQRRMLTNFPVAGKAPPVAAVLEGTGLVDGYFRYAVGTRSVGELLRLWWKLLLWRADVLVYLAPSRGIAVAKRDARFFRLCGIRRLIGVPVTDDMQRNRMMADGLEPEAERLARCVTELGDARLDEAASWELRLSTAECARAEEVLTATGGRPLIAVSIGTKVETNDWGRARWVEMLGRVADLYPLCALAIAGAASDAEYSEALAEAWRAAGAGVALNLCGVLSPRESAAVFARAVVYVGHDSGPMHLAAAVGTPCVAIFSARGLPRVWFPYGAGHRVIYHPVECAGCGLAVCVQERKKCLTSVEVEEVLAAVRETLDRWLGLEGVR